MNIYNFIVGYWDIIILAVVLIATFAYLIYKGEKGIVFKMLFALVTEAEKNLGGGTGVLKLATVIESVYPKLPKFLKMFITAQTLEKWVDEVLKAAKKTWASNSNLAAYIESETNKTAENTI